MRAEGGKLADRPVAARGRAGGGKATRDRIRETAERLFARDGIDRVTLRQIGRAARQRNVAAVQYHFGTKEHLLREILDHHLDEIDDRRRQLLDEQEHAGRIHDVDALLHVLVAPLAERLDDASGRAYLQIQAHQLSEGETLRLATRLMASRLRTALELSADPLRDRFVVLLLFHALADRARQERSRKSPEIDRTPFVAHLTRAIRGLYEGLDVR